MEAQAGIPAYWKLDKSRSNHIKLFSPSLPIFMHENEKDAVVYNPLTHKEDEHDDVVSDEQRAFAEDMFKLRSEGIYAVKSICFRKDCLEIKKNRLIEWHKVQPLIEHKIREFFIGEDIHFSEKSDN